MTAGEFDRAVVAGHTVVAIIPTTDNHRWACSRAWDIARASSDQSRVVLVDLFLDQPVLDTGAAQSVEDGVVDAFLYGVSLNHVARAQDSPELYYIGVGTPTYNAAEVWSHARWNRLAKGFSNEGALLLLFVPPQAIPHMALLPDGLIVLGPSGPQVLDELLSGNARWSEADVQVLWSAADAPQMEAPDDTVMPPVSTPDSEAAPIFSGAASDYRRWRTVSRRVGAATFAGVALLGIWFVFRSSDGSGRESVEPAFAVPGPTATPAASPEAAGGRARDVAEGDSLYYSVQVAAFNSQERAMEYGSAIERASLTVSVTPIRVGGRVWYRVLVGALPTATSADTVLRAIWRDRLVEVGQGTILRTPQAFDLGSRESADLAWEETQRLRDGGIPAYRVETSNGAARILVGAFETPDQSAVAESLLTAAGLPATLIKRFGIMP